MRQKNLVSNSGEIKYPVAAYGYCHQKRNII